MSELQSRLSSILIWPIAVLAFAGVAFVMSDSPGFTSPLQPVIPLIGLAFVGWYVLRRHHYPHALAYAVLAAPLFAMIALAIIAAIEGPTTLGWFQNLLKILGLD